jgi:GT2 family glycosyltransferase
MHRVEAHGYGRCNLRWASGGRGRPFGPWFHESRPDPILLIMQTGPPAPDPRPALCIVNFNGSGHLAGTLARVLELRAQFGDIVLVDDASTDDSVEIMRSLAPGFQVVVMPRNSGPGAARNAGARALDADRILFMDNDVTLQPRVLPLLEEALHDAPDATIAVPRVVSASDPDNVEYEGGDAHVSGLLRLRRPDSSGEVPATGGPPVAVGSLVTCCFLLDRKRWGDAPLFDEDFQIYLEDHELGLRARMRGLELLAVPAAVCLHGPGTPGLSIRASGRHTTTRIRHTILNRWQVILKLYETRTIVLLAPYLAAFELYQLAGCVALGWSREWRAAAGDLAGKWSGLRGRRRAVQPTRKRFDYELLVAGPHPFNPLLARRIVVRVSHRLLDLVATVNWALASRIPRLPRGRRS